MNLQYEKDNKERIPFEHYLEEFAKLDPEEASMRTGIPYHKETKEFQVRMMQKEFSYPGRTVQSGRQILLMRDTELRKIPLLQRL